MQQLEPPDKMLGLAPVPHLTLKLGGTAIRLAGQHLGEGIPLLPFKAVPVSQELIAVIRTEETG
jgi:hypothetical protein